MKYIIYCIMFFPSILFAQDIVQPEHIEDALQFLPVLMNAIKTSNWLLAGSLVSLIVTFTVRKYLLKRMKLKTGVLPIVSSVVGCFAGVSLAIINGADIHSASLAVLSGPLASTLWDSIIKYFFNKKV